MFNHGQPLSSTALTQLPSTNSAFSQLLSVSTDSTSEGAGQIHSCTDTSAGTASQPKYEYGALMRLSSGRQAVCSFLRQVVMRLLPNSLLGSRHNFQQLASVLHKILHLRRFECYTMHNLLQKFKLKDCVWLGPSSSSVSEQRIRFALLCRFLHWLLSGYLFPLLRSCFYITDTEPFKNRIFFYRRPLWKCVQDHAFHGLKTTQFQHITYEEAYRILEGRRLGFSRVRVLPKRSGIRAIVNCSGRNCMNPPPNASAANRKLVFRSVNRELQRTFVAFSREKTLKPSSMGCSVQGLDGIYRSVLSLSVPFRKLCLEADQHGQQRPKLYFVAVDVRQCFDSIKREKGIEIWQKILNDGDYIIRKWVMMTLSNSKVVRHFKKRAIGWSELGQFVEFAAKESQSWDNTVFCDQVVLEDFSCESVRQHLREHILNNIVLMDKEFYRQREGIPQGSMLSTLLCNLYLAYLERRRIRPAMLRRMGFRDDGRTWPWTQNNHIGTLMRQVDDFLLVTTCKESASAFMSVMHAGFPSYGCRVNAEKTRSNLPRETPGLTPENQIEEHRLHWCGLTFHTLSLDVFADYSRYTTSVLDSLTVPHHGTEGKQVRFSIRRMLSPKTHPLLLDSRVNSIDTVVINVYEIFWFTSIKLYSMLAQLRRCSSFQFVCSLFEESLKRFHWTTLRRFDKHTDAHYPLQKEETRYIALKAFLRVFRRKKTAYMLFVRQLCSELATKHNLRLQERSHIKQLRSARLSKPLHDMHY